MSSFLPDINYSYVHGSLSFFKSRFILNDRQNLQYIHVKLFNIIVLLFHNINFYCIYFFFVCDQLRRTEIMKYTYKITFQPLKYNYLKKINYSFKQADIHFM